MLKKVFLISLTFFFSLIFAIPASAQTLSIPGQIPELEEQISVTVSPSFPRPQDEVTITLEAYGTNLDRADITWKVNGTTSKKGKGEKIFKVTLGRAGETKKVGITIVPENGPAIDKTVTLSPQDTDMIWESRTYTPPFYRGKAMYSPQEKLVVVAMPNFISTSGTILNPSNLVYKWIKDTEVQGDASGYGINYFKFKGSILLKPMDIGVEVTSSGKEKSRNTITLAPTTPQVLFYENNPLYGILFNKNITNGSYFDVEEKTLEAFPYFMGANKKSDSNLTYEWSLNGDKISTPAGKSDMTFRNTEGKTGSSMIGLLVGNTGNYLEEAKQNVTINFSAPKSTFQF